MFILFQEKFFFMVSVLVNNNYYGYVTLPFFTLCPIKSQSILIHKLNMFIIEKGFQVTRCVNCILMYFWKN